MTFDVTVVLIALLVAALVLIGIWAYATANRLDRLHVRTDLSWQALDSALARRAVVVRAIAAATASGNDGQGKRLVTVADRAERADRAGREDAENALSGALVGVRTERLRPQLVAELADAEARVLIARRFHNDAVRDTLALGTRRPVRWLSLGGTAPLPTYFEIAERAGPRMQPNVSANRVSARVVLLGDTGRVLLLRGFDPQIPGAYFWFTVGGGVELGENLRATAVRELAEETGLTVRPDALHGPIWRRLAVFPFDGAILRSEELFFTIRVPEFEPHAEGFTELERRSITGFRWCTTHDIESLAASGEMVYPQDLAQLLDEAMAVAVAAGQSEHQVHEIR